MSAQSIAEDKVTLAKNELSYFTNKIREVARERPRRSKNSGSKTYFVRFEETDQPGVASADFMLGESESLFNLFPSLQDLGFSWHSMPTSSAFYPKSIYAFPNAPWLNQLQQRDHRIGVNGFYFVSVTQFLNLFQIGEYFMKGEFPLFEPTLEPTAPEQFHHGNQSKSAKFFREHLAVAPMATAMAPIVTKALAKRISFWTKLWDKTSHVFREEKVPFYKAAIESEVERFLELLVSPHWDLLRMGNEKPLQALIEQVDLLRKTKRDRILPAIGTTEAFIWELFHLVEEPTVFVSKSGNENPGDWLLRRFENYKDTWVPYEMPVKFLIENPGTRQEEEELVKAIKIALGPEVQWRKRKSEKVKELIFEIRDRLYLRR